MRGSPGDTATLAEARAAVERDWLNDRAQQSNEAFYERLRSNYTVRIDGDIDAPVPAGACRMRRSGWWRIAAAAILCAVAAGAQADIFRPAYLELRETGVDTYDVMWKVPAQGELRLAVNVEFPADTRQLTPPRGMFVDNAYVERWQIARPGGLAGQTIRIDGIASGVTDVIARVERLDGTSEVEKMLPAEPQFVVKGSTSAAAVAWSYLVLGVEHILGGIDHLLFVLALLLIVRGGKRIFFTITAFTLAHSITLVAATLGWVHVPGPPIEAMIALSIVFVAAEIVRGLGASRGSPRARPGSWHSASGCCTASASPARWRKWDCHRRPSRSRCSPSMWESSWAS